MSYSHFCHKSSAPTPMEDASTSTAKGRLGLGVLGSRSISLCNVMVVFSQVMVTNLWSMSQNNSFMKLWETEGELARPYDMTQYS